MAPQPHRSHSRTTLACCHSGLLGLLAPDGNGALSDFARTQPSSGLAACWVRNPSAQCRRLTCDGFEAVVGAKEDRCRASLQPRYMRTDRWAGVETAVTRLPGVWQRGNQSCASEAEKSACRSAIGFPCDRSGSPVSCCSIARCMADLGR